MTEISTAFHYNFFSTRQIITFAPTRVHSHRWHTFKMESLSEPIYLYPLPLLITLPCFFICWAPCWQVYPGQINSVLFFFRLHFSEQLLLWLIVYVLPLHLKITLPFDTNDCPWHACVKALSSYLHLIPEPNETGDWVPPCEPRLRVITMLEQSRAKLIMWVQWYFYWITFSRHRQRPSNPPRPTFFSPSINNLFQKDAWLLQAQVRMTLRVQHRQWTRSRCTAGRGKALLR